jgi:hypothetical protein
MNHVAEEARRRGFSRIVGPPTSSISAPQIDGIEWVRCETLLGAINEGLVEPVQLKRSRQEEDGDDEPPRKRQA